MIVASDNSRELIELPPGEVHLWYGPLAGFDAEGRERCQDVLDDAERLRYRRFISTEAADQFLVARAMLRRCLSSYSTAALPADWRFAVNRHGKPRVSDEHRVSWLSFNVSHTRGMVVCAFCRELEIGADVEPLERRWDPAVAERFFTPNEFAAIARATEQSRGELFLRTWTLKEAVIKALGEGLSCPLSAFDVQVNAEPPRMSFTEAIPDDPRHWQLFSFPLETQFQAAVAVRGDLDARVQLTLRPFAWE